MLRFWLCFWVLFFSAYPASASTQGASIVVGLESAHLYRQPDFLSATSGQLSYGVEVDVKKTHVDWFWVETDHGVGWMHRSALINPEQEYSSYEVFNGSNEGIFRKKNSDAGFRELDKLEGLRSKSHDLIRFAKVGELLSPLLRKEQP